MQGMQTAEYSRWRRVGDVLIVVLAAAVDLTAWIADREAPGGPTTPLLIVAMVTVVVYATLLLRWRYPLGVFCLQWGFTLGSLLMSDFQPFAGLLLALHAVASRRPASWSGPALASTALPFSIYSALAAGMGPSGSTTTFLQMLVLWLLVAAATWGVGRLSYLARQRARQHEQLVAAETAEAVRSERMHLARELHDIVAHTVTIMVIQASGAKAVLPSSEATVRQALEVIENSGVQAMTELHRMLNLLRSVGSERESAMPAIQPGLSDVADLVAAVNQAGTAVSLIEEGEAGPLDPSVAAAAYRVVQESITNAVKHAGVATAVTVRLCWTAMDLQVAVTSRQRGPQLPSAHVAALSSGHGLRGLRDRVSMVGGTFASGPVEDGFEVTALLPRHGVVATPAANLGQPQ